MKNVQRVLWLSAFVLLPFAGTAQRDSGGWCSNNPYSRLFNPATIEEIKGAVVSVEKITPESGMASGIHLTLKNEKGENIPVHLGPSWYVENQDIQFAAGDNLVVRGSKVAYQNAPALIAMTVQKGAQVLTLRDKKGNPNWNGLRQGKGGGKNKGKNRGCCGG